MWLLKLYEMRMSKFSNADFSEPPAYLQFTREEWCHFRQDTPLTLNEEDLIHLAGRNEVVSLKEVEEIFLPLARLLNLYITATQVLHRTTSRFLGRAEPRVPYIIGLAGSVAVGKSTTSRILRALLSNWPNHRKVEIVTTDGFLYSNDELERRGLTQRKGFPESYDIQRLLQFLEDIKAGEELIQAPIYSHHRYDILPNEYVVLEKPDIVIVEGLNILQSGTVKAGSMPQLFVSDFFDFTIFVDAEMETIQKWYVDRVLTFHQTSFQDPQSYFHYLTKLSVPEVNEFANNVWKTINGVNLLENILPFKNRARLILWKDSDHSVQKVFLRKL